MTATPVLAAGGQLAADLLRSDVAQADDLIVRVRKLSDLVIVRREQGDGVDVVEIARHGLHDARALVGVRAAGELIEQEQGIPLLNPR